MSTDIRGHEALLYQLHYSELRSCVKVEVDVLGSPVPNKPTVSVDVKQHFNKPHYYVPNNDVSPTSEDIKHHIIIISCITASQSPGCGRVDDGVTRITLSPNMSRQR